MKSRFRADIDPSHRLFQSFDVKNQRVKYA